VGSRDAVHNLSTRLCSDRSAGRVHQVRRLATIRYFLAYKKAACLFVCVVCLNNQWIGGTLLLVQWFTQRTDAHQSPIRIKAADAYPLEKRQCPWLIRAPDCVGAKPCPIVFHNRFNGSPSKRTRPGVAQGFGVSACTYSEQHTIGRLNGLPIRPDGYCPFCCCPGLSFYHCLVFHSRHSGSRT